MALVRPLPAGVHNREILCTVVLNKLNMVANLVPINFLQPRVLHALWVLFEVVVAMRIKVPMATDHVQCTSL